MATEDTWVEYAEDRLLGQHVAMVRYLSKEETEILGWRKRTLCLQFSDGSLLFASSDDEGNDAGTLKGVGSTDNLPEEEDPEFWTFPVLGP